MPVKNVYILLVAGLFLLTGCSSTTWEDARQADTYDAYQAYIDDNPDGEFVDQANQRADSLYWNSIKNDSTAQTFENYLAEFPNGQFQSEAQAKFNQFALNKGGATKARVTGSNVIIRSDHTTESPSAGVVAQKGTTVQILDQYLTGNSNEAILSRNITISQRGNQIAITKGKAVRILEDRNDSVRASFSVPNFGGVQATISKNDIEAMSGEKWYKVHTTDGITGWIYGKFIEEL